MDLTTSDVFISSSHEDKAFANKLRKRLRESGISAWNDTAPSATNTREFQNAVSLGIQHSDNFVYILSPGSLLSETCLVELFEAKKNRKPIITVVAQKPTVEDENRFIHPALVNSIWINFDRSVFVDKYAELIAELRNDSRFKSLHSIYLFEANLWVDNNRNIKHLLSGKERIIAHEWLNSQVSHSKNYGVTLVQAEYISESKKYIEGSFSDVFFSYDSSNLSSIESIRDLVTLAGFTSWNDREEMAIVCRHLFTTNVLIEQTSCFLFFLSAQSISTSFYIEELKYAFELNKKIITIKLDDTSITRCPNFLKTYPVIDLNNHGSNTLQVTTQHVKKLLLRYLNEDRELHNVHKELLVRTLAWRDLELDAKILLSGYELVYAEKWLQRIVDSSTVKPLTSVVEFIDSSAIGNDLSLFDAYLSYANEDYLYAKRISYELHDKGKNIWYDPKEMKNASDNDEAVKDTITRSHCVLLLISPEIFDSPSVKKELRWAKSLHKRIIPVLIAPVKEDVLPIEYQRGIRVNGIFQSDSITHTISKILRALGNVDELTCEHTKWLLPALKWDERGRKSAELLSYAEAVGANNWLRNTLNQFDSPHPVVQHLEYIKQSVKKAESSKVKTKRLLYTAAFCIVVLFVTLFWTNSKLHYAEGHYREVGTHLLAYQAESTEDIDPTLSLRLAESAFQFNQNDKSTYRSLLNSYFTDNPFYDKLYESKEDLYSVAYSPDNRRLLVASGEKRAILFDNAGKELMSFHHKDIVWAAKFSPDGKYIATASQDNEFRIWTLDGNVLRRVNYETEVFDIAFSPDGEFIVVAGGDRSVSVYNFKGERVSRFIAGDSAIELIEFSPSGSSILSLSADNEVKLWSKLGVLKETMKFKSKVEDVHFYDTDTLLLVAGNEWVTGVWDLKGEQYLCLKASCAASFIGKDGSAGFITANADNNVRIWNKKGELIKAYIGHASKVNAACTSSGGDHLLTVSGDGGIGDKSLRIWQTANAPSHWEVKRQNTSMKVGAYSHDGKYFAVAINESVEIFDERGKGVGQFSTVAEITDLDFSKDGKSIFTAHEDEWVREYSWNGNKLQEIKTGHESISSLAVSSSADILIYTGYEPVISVYNLKTKDVTELVGHEESVNSLAFSCDGSLFISASEDSTAKVWDLNAQLQTKVKSYDGVIIDAQISPDNNSLVTSSSDSLVVLWSIDGDSLTSLQKQHGVVSSVAFTADGKHILTACLEYTTSLWSISGDLVYQFKPSSELEKQNKVLVSPRKEFVLLLNDDELERVGKAKIFRLDPRLIIDDINNVNSIGRVWPLDDLTRAQYHVLE